MLNDHAEIGAQIRLEVEVVKRVLIISLGFLRHYIIQN